MLVKALGGDKNDFSRKDGSVSERYCSIGT